MKEITVEQYQVVKEFANELLEIIDDKQAMTNKHCHTKEVLEVSNIIWNFMRDIIKNQVETYDVRFELFVANMQAYRDKKVVEEKA